MEMTFKLKDGMYVAQIDEATANELGVANERRLLIVKTDTGYALEDAETVEDMAMIEQITEEDGAVLERLAKSERIDMVREIMDEYDKALEELAK